MYLLSKLKIENCLVDHVKYYPKPNNNNETTTGVIKSVLDDGSYQIKPDGGGEGKHLFINDHDKFILNIEIIIL